MLLLCLFAVAATAGLSWLVCWAMVIRFARRPADEADGADVILVLGSRLVGGKPTSDFTTRLERAATMGDDVPVLISGGLSRDGRPSEALAGRDWLLQRGLKGRPILLEDRSRNTLENLYHVRALMKRHGFRRPLLITSRYHLARCYLLARGLGLSPVLCPTDAPALRHPLSLARTLFEAMMINWYFVGRLCGRLTRNQTLLAKLT